MLIGLIVNEQTCVAQNNFAQHDWSCVGRITEKRKISYPRRELNPESSVIQAVVAIPTDLSKWKRLDLSFLFVLNFFYFMVMNFFLAE
jgi:hypothetical protein